MLRASHVVLVLSVGALSGCLLLFHDDDTGAGGATSSTAGGPTAASSGLASSTSAVGSAASASVTGGGGSSPGKAIELDGATYVSFPSTQAFTATGFSWELWFSAASVPTALANGRAQTFIGVLGPSPCEDIYLGFGSEETPQRELTFRVDANGDCPAHETDPVRYYPVSGFTNDKWYHVVAVDNSPAQRTELYLDGHLVAQRNHPSPPVNRAAKLVEVGRWDDSTTITGWFSGRIDELRFYGAPLSAAQVLIHYAAGAGTYGMQGDPDIVAGWHFDEGAGNQPADYVNNVIGTINGNPLWADGIVSPP